MDLVLLKKSTISNTQKHFFYSSRKYLETRKNNLLGPFVCHQKVTRTPAAGESEKFAKNTSKNCEQFSFFLLPEFREFNILFKFKKWNSIVYYFQGYYSKFVFQKLRLFYTALKIKKSVNNFSSFPSSFNILSNLKKKNLLFWHVFPSPNKL